MAEAKHTPGPWESRGQQIFADCGLLATVGFRLDAEEQAANVALLVTSPELLSELKTTTFLLTSACLVIKDSDARATALAAVKRARAVIAKATGSAA